MKKVRCHWVTEDPLYIQYHDKEWGRRVRDDQTLFELLNLEGMQAGLSWLTVLKKREAYRKAFDQFDAHKIARYDAKKVAVLMKNEGIIRHRLKILAIISNAKAFLAIQKEFISFYAFLKPFEGQPSEVLSKALKQRGFKFVGPTICHSFLQACGLRQDHSPECFLRQR